jgi:LmbE family N-acetylglucosaminyl deacetylase
MQAAVIVAHPDDETLWSGGTILMHPDWQWTVITLCRKSDSDRAPKFFRALERLHASGAMGDLDDGPEQHPIPPSEIENAVLSLLPETGHDIIFTHSPFGEYTRHRRHEETGRAVMRLWRRKAILSPEVRLFAYEDGGKQYLPRPVDHAHMKIRLSDSIWEEKVHIMRDLYGFAPDTFEVCALQRVEAFWRFDDGQAFETWLKTERGNESTRTV